MYSKLTVSTELWPISNVKSFAVSHKDTQNKYGRNRPMKWYISVCVIVPNAAIGHSLVGTIADVGGLFGFPSEIISDNVVIVAIEIFFEHRCTNICQLSVCSAPTLLTLCQYRGCS